MVVYILLREELKTYRKRGYRLKKEKDIIQKTSEKYLNFLTKNYNKGRIKNHVDFWQFLSEINLSFSIKAMKELYENIEDYFFTWYEKK